MELHLNNKTALVCAASKGLGLAVAHSLAREGCRLFLCARQEEPLRQAAEELEREYGTNVGTLAIDLTDTGAAGRLQAAANDKFGPMDILINNVGGPAPSSATATPESEWRAGFERLFLSATSLSQGVIASMKAKRFGRIITITSLSVLEPIENLVVSTSMRAAVTAFNKTLSQEVAPFGITVNTVMPGVIHTQRIEQLRHAKASRDGTTFEDEMQKTRATIPMHRLGKPEELADLVTFLCSPRAAYITGANIPVDGGQRKGWV